MTEQVTAAPRKGYWRPQADVPTQLPQPIQWTWWRKALLGIALLCSAYFFVTVCGISWARVPAFFQPHSGRVDFPWPTDAAGVQAQFALFMRTGVAALIVLLCLCGVAGTQAAGVAWGRTGEHHFLGLRYYMRTAYLAMVVLVFVQGLPLALFPQLQAFSSTRSGSMPLSFDIFTAFTAGFAEEVIVTVFLYGLLERIPLRRHATSLAATGWGTAIIVFAHWSYHAHYGAVVLLVVASAYFSVLCWRYTRSLWAIVAGHVIWNLTLTLPNPLQSVGVQISLFLVGLAAWILTRK